MELAKHFDSIRPYRDEEVGPAIKRLLAHPRFGAVLDYLFKNVDREEVKKQLGAISTVEQFQVFFSHHTVQYVLDSTSDGLSTQGLEKLNPEVPYLFIANHRDIVLDAAIMQYALFQSGRPTSQITFGQNLMSEQILLDIGKLNKMFTFFRGGSRITQYRNALLNSAYINHVIKEGRESIWIAQRNGRTKDGKDLTQSALIKMLSLKQGPICSSLAGLNIVPVSISYEIEPCEIQKVRETYISRRKEYVKAPMEDLQSILSGITSQKGRIHYVFGTPLNDFITSLEEENLHENEIMDRVAGEIDRQVHDNYRLWPGNYFAYDRLHGVKHFSNQYGEDDVEKFNSRMNTGITAMKGLDPDELRELFVNLYAGPVNNKNSNGPHS